MCAYDGYDLFQKTNITENKLDLHVLSSHFYVNIIIFR